MKLPRLLLAILLPVLAAAPAAGDPVPDFSAPDINGNSNRRRATALPVSPRDYMHQVTLWFFGWESCSFCRNDFLILRDIFNELNGTTVLPVDIIGVNSTTGGSNLLMYAGKPLSWVRDTDLLSIWASWGAVYRDAIIVDPLNGKIEVYNLNTHDLTTTAVRNELKAKLVSAATPADTDNDHLPDYWEQWAYGSLSRNGATIGADGIPVLLHYAHCSPAPRAGALPGQPCIFQLPFDGSFSVYWTRRRGTAFGLTLTPEFAQALGQWTTTGHGFKDTSVRTLYDGSGGELVEWHAAGPSPFRLARVRAVLP